MKKIRVLFSAMVVTIAISSAFASASMVDVWGWIKLTADGTPVSTDCILVKKCNQIGSIRCKDISGVDLFKLNASQTACTVAVFDRPSNIE